MKLGNINWDEVAKQEGIDISDFHRSATTHTSIRSTTTTLTNMSISEEQNEDEEEQGEGETSAKTEGNAMDTEESV